jgi:hypothetical protein
MMTEEEIALAYQTFRPGVYEHSKTGGKYTALSLVAHHDNRQPMVLYFSHEYGTVNVRPLKGWPGDPDGWDDAVGMKELYPGDFMTVPRFRFLGKHLNRVG